MTYSVKLGSKEFSKGDGPYIIAEIGVNHGGSFDLAKQLIDEAKEGGADAAKFQSYKAETLASVNSPAYWDTSKEPTKSQYELFKKYDSFNADEYCQLADYCNKVGIDFLSTPFDEQSVDFLDPIMPFFKVASADLTNIPLLRKIATKRKPVVLSTGASTLGEIDIALDNLHRHGCSDVVLLHCVLNYPTDNANAHLRMIEGLKRCYPQHLIGYSDHTLPDDYMSCLTTAFLLGATVIEKHFTHDKTLPGNDHYHAMNKSDLSTFVKRVNEMRVLLGEKSIKSPIPTEKISRENARRSIVLKGAVQEGEVLSESHLICKRPGGGISPLHWDDIMGMKVTRSLAEDHILQWRDVT